MRIGVIGDSHGNAPGLALSLRFLGRQKVDMVVHLGDAVGYYPHAGAVCLMLERAGAACIQGNHEAMLMGDLPVPPGAADVVRLPQSWDALPPAWRGQVERNGPALTLELAGRRVLCVHGSPRLPLAERVDAQQARRVDFDADVLLMGHTHRPLVERNRGRLVLNPGSCGLPRDRGDHLSLAVLDLDAMEARVFRLPFAPSRRTLGMIHERVAECVHGRNESLFGEIRSAR